MVGKRLKDLTDKLSEGELNFEDINLEKELAILGLEFAFESNEQFKENEYVYHFRTNNEDIYNLAIILQGNSNFVGPTKKFVEALIKEQQKNDERTSTTTDTPI